mmetsp:Transcript_129484/g.252108  ORF Transcript_129484/g.252108 Transcript_129484/m.252108 type:complete len:135 (-) Transcript_129484:323-727(-)
MGNTGTTGIMVAPDLSTSTFTTPTSTTTATVTTTATSSFKEAEAESGSSALPFWTWSLLVVGILAVASLIYFLCSDENKRRKKRKSKKRRGDVPLDGESGPAESGQTQHVPLVMPGQPMQQMQQTMPMQSPLRS